MNDTTSPAYWLDTNTLIESMKRWYRFDMVPGCWSFIDKKVEEGAICCPVKIYDELVDQVVFWPFAVAVPSICLLVYGKLSGCQAICNYLQVDEIFCWDQFDFPC